MVKSRRRWLPIQMSADNKRQTSKQTNKQTSRKQTNAQTTRQAQMVINRRRWLYWRTWLQAIKQTNQQKQMKNGNNNSMRPEACMRQEAGSHTQFRPEAFMRPKAGSRFRSPYGITAGVADWPSTGWRQSRTGARTAWPRCAACWSPVGG